MTFKHKVTVRHSSIIISNYKLGDDPKLEGMLSVWDPIYFTLNAPGYFYNEEEKLLHLPRGISLSYLEKSFNTICFIDYDHDPFDKVSIKLNVEPRSDIQRKSISFLLGEGDFGYTKKYSQQALDLDTGDGKTYCVIASLSFIGMKSIVVTPNDNIKAQWMKSFKNMTNLDTDTMYNIAGSQAIKKLLKMKKIPYKVFFVNHQTIQSYAKANGWDAIGELFKILKIGIKVFDEAHMQFENMNRIDLNTNTKKTVYLTANFERSEHKENKIFKTCFKNVPKYGIETRDEKRKHIVCVIIEYDSKPPLDVKMMVKGPYGFDRNKYIDYQLTTDIFYEALMYVCNYIGDKDGKMLITFSKNSAIDTVYDYLQENFETRVPFKYNSTVTEDDKVKALSSDFILSTPKSLGTGSDLPGLRYLINTEQYTSKVTANQMPGRLREYSPDEYTFYFEIIDTGFPQTAGMLNKRMNVFKKKFVKIIKMKLGK